MRVVVGVGFADSGMASLAPVLQQLPGACKPAHGAPRFWSALSVQTQLVLDAVMASAEAGGTEVPVAISVDSGNKIL